MKQYQPINDNLYLIYTKLNPNPNNCRCNEVCLTTDEELQSPLITNMSSKVKRKSLNPDQSTYINVQWSKSPFLYNNMVNF